MNPQKDYALLCEFLTQSTNGMYSYMHVFDRTIAKAESPAVLNGFLAVRFRDMGEKAHVNIYMTDADNTLVEKGGKLFDQAVQGANVHIIARIRGLVAPKPGEYRFWARIDAGEPMFLCSWMVEHKA